ncbi:MAG: biopolymer transporter ExbD [Pseudomonadota bacterium]|nr:biopolymer transporter ExbD [Pseudomonadota bacterium]
MQGAPQDRDGSGDEDDAIFAEINITPLTDVFLVLLIIFMVVSSSMVEAEKQAAAAKGLLSERALQVQTPQGTGETPLVPKDIVISVLPDGTLFVEDDQITVDQLDAKLAEIKRGAASTRVVIRGDQTATYDLIMKVISKAREAGLTDVALASRSRQ